TFGGSIGQFASTRPLTIDDAHALQRLPQAIHVVPAVQGNADVEAQGRVRRTTVFGVGAQFAEAFAFAVAGGRFLPPDDPSAPRPVAVLGATLRRELFGDGNPLGASIRIGGERYRVIGFMQAKGSMLGFDLDDTVYIPAARALSLFNRAGLFEIHVVYAPGAPVSEVTQAIRRTMIARHGREDFTIVTQQEMLDTLGDILGVLTAAVAALGGISLLVGGVGIFTIMTIAVRERTGEIGLLRALGATRGSVRRVFLGEAVMLSAAGGAGGLVFGAGLALLCESLLPALPVKVDWAYVMLAEGIAIAIGLLAGVLPAARAARLEPVDALRAE
ncbi:MAG: ABC transporter permease, partial [Gammaproteobacteria bacterium]|nr:ABC transporter permease [Gammaproteobacteria bacterium]